jgi:hypothetical protein
MSGRSLRPLSDAFKLLQRPTTPFTVALKTPHQDLQGGGARMAGHVWRMTSVMDLMNFFFSPPFFYWKNTKISFYLFYRSNLVIILLIDIYLIFYMFLILQFYPSSFCFI